MSAATMLVLYDDARARTFEPFASTRPLCEMRAGALLVRERWAMHFAPQPGTVTFAAGRRMLDFDEPGAAQPATGVLPAGTIIANARFAPALPPDLARAAQRAATCSLWRTKDALVAVRLRAPLEASTLDDGSITLDELHAGTGAITDLDGWWHEEVWDYIRHLGDQLTSDLTRAATAGVGGDAPAHATVIGKASIRVDASAEIEPHVVLDASAGPIHIDAKAHVRAFSRITGPCYIGREVNVVGGDISACSIGEVSKVRGELSTSIVLGHSNKGHDGFVGHSYLGRWVNLGASTVTSNLKNTYGTVALWTPSGVRDTGLQFLGTLFGDHVKTGIGLRLTTGTVLGAGANVYGSMPPKAVAPFSWGDGEPYGTYDSKKFAETAARMMSRRHVELTDRARRHLAALHASRWSPERGR